MTKQIILLLINFSSISFNTYSSDFHFSDTIRKFRVYVELRDDLEEQSKPEKGIVYKGMNLDSLKLVIASSISKSFGNEKVDYTITYEFDDSFFSTSCASSTIKANRKCFATDKILLLGELNTTYVFLQLFLEYETDYRIGYKAKDSIETWSLLTKSFVYSSAFYIGNNKHVRFAHDKDMINEYESLRYKKKYIIFNQQRIGKTFLSLQKKLYE